MCLKGNQLVDVEPLTRLISLNRVLLEIKDPRVKQELTVHG